MITWYLFWHIKYLTSPIHFQCQDLRGHASWSCLFLIQEIETTDWRDLNMIECCSAGARIKVMRHIDFGTEDQIRGRNIDTPSRNQWRVGQRRRTRNYNDVADNFQNVPDFGQAVASIGVSFNHIISLSSFSWYVFLVALSDCLSFTQSAQWADWTWRADWT